MRTPTGLERFGVVAPTIVREPARDDQDIPICAECGYPVAKSKGPHRVEKPQLVDDNLADALEYLVTYGWRCDRHAADVVMPSHASGPDAPGMIDGWIGVQLRFADEHVRYVPIPEREVADVE
ncbi:hypothetical protein ACFOZ7_09610 [Natribaculum luteum]|uniref:Uncharacterized protein n=1 Tax=Natribaculum luteum TaxID=1586232 RepID=A0ABD5NZL5_9EURY|nr:hypothetical protein [Natribaculum luteum]